MWNTTGRLAAAFAASAVIFFHSPNVFSQEDTEYRKFKLEDSSCDVGVHYKKGAKALTLGVSAIATGKGAEFRKWTVTDIRLRLGDKRIKPDEEGKIYVTEESLFRVPAAIAFAAIGAFGEYGGSNLNNNLSKIGVGVGLFFLALTAKGEISGERCLFYIPEDMADKIEEGKDDIEITIENEDQHLKNTIKIGLIKPSVDTIKKYNFSNMNKDELSKRMDSLKNQVVLLEEEQSAYKYGTDPQYDAIQRKIDLIETERGFVYRAWFEKKNGRDRIQ